MVVLFPTAQAAATFFANSAERWPACANRQFTTTMPETGTSTVPVEAVSRAGNTLTATIVVGYTAQHVLMVANNIIIDAVTGGNAVEIAQRIAAKVAALS